MDEVVLKKVCNFLQKQEDHEAIFKTFWKGTNNFYPPGQSKTKLKAWLKGHRKSFEIIKSETGDPFGKIKLKVEAPIYDLPDTTWAEDFEITQKLIESIDNKAENGHLYSSICNHKALIFPEILQDKTKIRKWLIEHENLFEMINNDTGGLHSVEVLDEARNLKEREPLMPPATRPNKTRQRQSKGKPQKGNNSESVDLLILADNIAQRISEKISNSGGTFPLDSLLKAKDVIYPLSDEDALMCFLAAFPLKFEIIDIEGLGQWVHLKDDNGAVANDASANDAINKVTSFIFQNGGTIPFVNLFKDAGNLIGETVNSPDALSAWLNANANAFEVLSKPGDPGKPWQVRVKIGNYPRFCQHYLLHGQCPKKKCQFLHICKAYVCQPLHSYEACNLSHDIRDAHNKVIVDRMGALSKESDAIVVTVLRKSCFPRVCTEYNKNGICPRGDKCHFLHMCGNYVLNRCEGYCSLSHNVADSLHNIELLKKYALLPSQKLSEEIVKANIAFAQVKKPQPSQSVEMKVAKLQPPQAAKIKEGKVQTGPIVEGYVKKRRQRTRRRRRRKSGQASSTVDDASSSATDSTAGDLDNASVASSSHNAMPSLLSSENIQKSNLTTSLTGYQKVENWMGSPAKGSDQVSSQTHKLSDSSSNSEASHVSNQSSVVSSQSLIWQDDLQKQVFITILEKYDGNASFKRISKDKELFGREVDVVKWFQNQPQKLFILHRDGRGKIDSVSAFSRKARICLNYGGKRGCDKPTCSFLHICRDHIEGHCPKGKRCNLNHDICSDLIAQAAKHMGLTPSQLFTLIRVSIPAVCQFFNQGHCDRGVFCSNLHVCKGLVKGRRFCKTKACKYSHEQALKQEPATKILKMYQLYGKQPNYEYICKMIFVFDTRKQSGQRERGAGHCKVQSEREVTDEPRVVSGLMDVDLTQEVDSPVQVPEEVTPNICSQFLTGQCRSKKCSDIHFTLPYCWQFKLPNSSGSWCSFDKTDCENIEKYFCDVNCTATELNISTKISGNASSVRLDFQAMSGHPQASPHVGFTICRLECQKASQCETKWMWYKLESSRWVQYEDNKASVFEELFLEGKLAIDYSTQRRRPAAFLTQSQVDDKHRGTAEEQHTSEFTATPTPQSPVSSQPPQLSSGPVRESISSPLESHNYHRTRVEPGSPEYKEIEELLGGSSGQNGLVINQIAKIVSGDLWNKYKSKKKSMTDDLRPGEHLNDRNLFVPCLREDLERIMKGNVCDSRIYLPNQPLDRYYFTSDASLCIQTCRENNIYPRYLIVCQVLLGSSTHGLSEFPRRPDGRFYDSLVDKIDKPSVFVIKDVDQCYPAYIIDFSPVTSQVLVTGAMLREFEIVDGNHGLAATPQHSYPQAPPYQPVPPHAHPLSPAYVPQSTNISSVIPQQQPLPPNTPAPDYVKAAPPYSERPPHHADPPPDYTPSARADLQHPENVGPIPNVGQITASRLPRDSKEKKDCVVM